ncbi:MAG: hypothetical protein AAGE83_12085 [Pseudomonadota bacterium]
MTTRIEAFVLLNGGWKPDAMDFAAALGARYPGIGRVRGKQAEEGSGTPHVISVDGAALQMFVVNAPYPTEQLLPPLRLIEHVDPEPVARAQVAYVMLSAEWPDLGEDASPAERAEIAGAYSALLTLVTAMTMREAPALAAFWTESWRFWSAEQVEAAAEGVMRGEPPFSLWYSLAEIKGARAGGGDMLGAMTFGLKPFCGREVEVAPAPVGSQIVQALAKGVAERMLSGALVEDHEALMQPGLMEPAVIRLADRFMRPRQPVVLVVPPDAGIDAQTLESKKAAGAARGGGLVSRFFGGKR